MNEQQLLDPLEYLARLNPKSVSIEVIERQQRSAQTVPMARQRWTPIGTRLVGLEHSVMLKGLTDGPSHIAYYRMTYSIDALLKLENMFYRKVLSIAEREQWKVSNGRPRLRRVGILALLEKYFNVCKVCRGTTFKQDRKPCKSCVNGYRKRSQRECGTIIGVDHKSYVKTWEKRVNSLIALLDEWEESVRHKIALNLRRCG